MCRFRSRPQIWTRGETTLCLREYDCHQKLPCLARARIDAIGAEQSKLLVTEPEAVIAEILEEKAKHQPRASVRHAGQDADAKDRRGWMRTRPKFLSTRKAPLPLNRQGRFFVRLSPEIPPADNRAVLCALAGRAHDLGMAPAR